MSTVLGLLQAIPYEALLIQTLNGIVTGMILALIGAALQITTLRPLLGRDPLTTILATFGISLVMQNYALWQFGPVARKIPEPFSGQFTLFYLEYPWYRVLIAILSAAIIGCFYLFLKYGTYGIWILSLIHI